MELMQLDGLGYSRDEMPQIEPHLVGHFLGWLKNRYGVSHSQVNMVSAYKILPTQDAVNAEKVEIKRSKIIESNFKEASKLIILSTEFRQLDGHNTVVALLGICPMHEVPVVVVNLSIANLLAYAREYPYTTYKSISDIT